MDYIIKVAEVQDGMMHRRWRYDAFASQMRCCSLRS